MLIIEYDGKLYNGWQKQPTKLNIQGNIEEAIKKVTGEEVDLIGSGRTDAGVHSLGQVANFKLEKSTLDISKMAMAINSQLKPSIVIKEAKEVREDFHSRYNAKKKTYRYVIRNAAMPSAIYRNFEHFYKGEIDVKKMQEAAKYLVGEHDFTSFKSSGNGTKSPVRTIYNLEVKRPDEDKEKIYIEITGNGFLYNMVRIISGTLLDVGTGKIKPEDVKKILDAKDRKIAGKTLPAQGLFLVKVEYEDL